MSRLRDTILLPIFALALAACASGPIQLHEAPGASDATAAIVLPEQLEVVTVNGVEIAGAGGLLKKGDTTLEVSPGRYEVLAFYRELWERGDQHDMLRSDPALFVVEAAAGQRYRLDYTRPETAAEAHALAADFEGWVEDLASGARTPSLASGLKFRRGVVAAATFDDTLVPVAPSDGTRQRVAPRPQPVPPPQSQSQDDSDWLAIMKGWWSEASQEERRAFLRWVGERR